MKALTICQPYAHAIIHQGKRIENRTWRTSYRGRIAIHAGASRSWLKPPWSQFWPHGLIVPTESDLVFGAIVGFATLADCVGVYDARFRDDPWAFGPICWLLEDVVACEPISAKGHQNLWVWQGEEPAKQEVA